MSSVSHESPGDSAGEEMATIYDVARQAGVSAKTVSRVLNGDGPVGPDTRAAVENAMREMNYVPSSAARSMRSSRSGLVGLITGSITGSVDPDTPAGLPDMLIVKRIQHVLSDAGMTLMIADTGGRPNRIPTLIQTFLQHRVEGLIYVADYHRPVSLPPVPPGTPFVLANCFDDPGTPCVLPDDAQAARVLTQALIAAGHRHIAFLTLPPGMEAERLRMDGYRQAHAAAGLPVDPALLAPGEFEGAPDENERTWALICRMMAQTPRPSVLMCGNDRMAMRIYGILRSHGIRVPDDLSVAGHDNHRAIAEVLYPPLTTVELPYAAMGRLTGELLLKLIAGTVAAPVPPIRVEGPVHWRASVLVRATKPIHQLVTAREE